MPGSDKVYQGDPVRFSRHRENRAVDVIRAGQRREHNVYSSPGSYGRKSCGIIPILNNTGAVLTADFPIVGLSAPIILPSERELEFVREPTLTGITPTASDLDTFAILQRPAAAGEIVDGLLVGLSNCKVDIKETGHKYVKAVAGETTHLESCASGTAKIRWSPTGETGEQWAVVQLPSPDAAPAVKIGQLNEAWTNANTVEALPLKIRPNDSKDHDGNLTGEIEAYALCTQFGSTGAPKYQEGFELPKDTPVPYYWDAFEARYIAILVGEMVSVMCGLTIEGSNLYPWYTNIWVMNAGDEYKSDTPIAIPGA